MQGVEQSTLWRSLVLVLEADDRNTWGIHMRVTKSVISLILAGCATQLSPEGAAVRIVSASISFEQDISGAEVNLPQLPVVGFRLSAVSSFVDEAVGLSFMVEQLID